MSRESPLQNYNKLINDPYNPQCPKPTSKSYLAYDNVAKHTPKSIQWKKLRQT